MMQQNTEWDASERFSIGEARDNYLRLRASEMLVIAEEPPTALVEKCRQLPLTHTTELQFIESIIFGSTHRGAGLWSIEDRTPGEARFNPKWLNCCAMGLQSYVTGYCGIHDPRAVTVKNPVGLFLRMSPNAGKSWLGRILTG